MATELQISFLNAQVVGFEKWKSKTFWKSANYKFALPFMDENGGGPRGAFTTNPIWRRPEREHDAPQNHEMEGETAGGVSTAGRMFA